MYRYRLLRDDELHNLEKEFIEYLVINGITADEWENMKAKSIDRAERIIELFSDVVFESILRKVSYIEHREKNSIKIFQCLEHEMVLVGMESDDQSVDFNDPEFLAKASVSPPDSIKVYTSVKKYSLDRERELFELLESGGLITDSTLFKAISMALVKD